jgi:hypothetical protein
MLTHHRPKMQQLLEDHMLSFGCHICTEPHMVTKFDDLVGVTINNVGHLGGDIKGVRVYSYKSSSPCSFNALVWEEIDNSRRPLKRNQPFFLVGIIEALLEKGWICQPVPLLPAM